MFRLFRFLSTPSARRATNQSTTALTPLVFLSTPSARRATSVLWAMTNWHRYFYPRPPRGGRRRGNGGTACGSKNFYPRPPRGGRRARWNPLVLIPVFLSTPSARRATAIDVSGQIGRQISIHALREEGDLSASYYYTFSKISIHALREEGDQEQLLAEINRRRFLSTPSARRATCSPLCRLCTPRHFYPRPPRGGRRVPRTRRPQPVHFYPRPPRGGRLLVRVKVAGVLKFLSTPSARRATSYLPGTAIVDLFLSTPSARRATPARARLQLPAQISIHALREEGDCPQMPSLCGSAYFYPRPPRGGRPSLAFSLLCNREISIHALREEGDGCSIDLGHIVDVFLSTPSARRATAECIRTRL